MIYLVIGVQYTDSYHPNIRKTEKVFDKLADANKYVLDTYGYDHFIDNTEDDPTLSYFHSADIEREQDWSWDLTPVFWHEIQEIN